MANRESLDEQQKRQQQKKRKDNLGSVVLSSNADGVSLHQFPADENVRQQWIVVRSKREPSSWIGSGHICSAHFTDDSYEGFGAKLAGFSICTWFY